jgi:hypothetical protein
MLSIGLYNQLAHQVKQSKEKVGNEQLDGELIKLLA